MHYEKAFFDLQVRFAQTAARLADVPLERALLDWTNLYARFGAGRAFDPRHPLWGACADGLRDAADPVEWTWRYLRRCPVHLGAPPVVATGGCFSYACVGDGAVRLHFSAPAQADDSPLAGSQASFRRTELRSLFAHLREQAPDADPLVHGTRGSITSVPTGGSFPRPISPPRIPSRACARFRCGGNVSTAMAG